MKTRIFFFSLLLLLSFKAEAYRQQLSISGRVMGAEKPVAGAQVFLLQQDQILLESCLTDGQGKYELKKLPEGPCFLKVTAAGYEPFTSEVMNLSETISMPDISLRVTSRNLKEVTVSSKKPLIQADADKVVLNVSSSLTNDGNTVLEVLKNAPNVSVDQDENIALKGKQGITVYMDGRLVPLQGSELAAYLKGISANSVDKIELISNPGARYDAAGTAGVIHIKTKKERRKGLNGTVNGSYTQGTYPKYNGGFTLNYRNQKANAYVNYNGGLREFTNQLDLKRRFIGAEDADTLFHQQLRTKYEMPNHQLTAGVDYTLSPKSSLGMVFSGGLNHIKSHGQSHTDVANAADVPLYQIKNTTEADNKWSNYAVNLNLRQQTGKAGNTLTVNADYARYQISNAQEIGTLTQDLTGAPVSPLMQLWGDMDGFTDIRSLKADYEQAIDDKTRLEGGVKTSYVTADNTPVFYNNGSGGKAYDAGKSNHFIYTENINAAYVNGSRDWEKWSGSVGLRLEHTLVNGDEKTTDTSFTKQYVNLFPNISVTRHLNAANDLGLTFSRRIERPDYRQLNPFRTYMDQSSVHQGNPNLNPATTWNAELSHIYKGRFVTTLGFGKTKDVITQVIKPGLSDEGTKMTVITDENLAVNTNVSLSGAYPVQVTKWWNSTNSFTAYYTYFEGNLQQTQLAKGSFNLQLNTTNTFTLPYNFSAELSGWYQGPQVYGYMDLKSMYAVNAGIQKTFWDRKGSVKLSVNDLFRSMSPRGSSSFATYHEDFIVTRDTRTVGISFSYRFGNSKLGQISSNKGGAAEEMKRAGGN